MGWVLTSSSSVATSVPSIPLSIHLSLALHRLIPPQFDHPFVEVHRVRKFRFQPQHQELVSLEDLSETPKKTGFGPICSAQTTCNYSNAHSSWTCDGETLPQAAVQVR